MLFLIRQSLLALACASAAMAADPNAVPTRDLAVRQDAIGDCEDEGIYTTENGLNFTLHCGQNNPHNDAVTNDQGKGVWFYTSSYANCLEHCSRFWGDAEGCFGIVWASDGGHCWLRTSNVSAAGLIPTSGAVSALVDRSQMKGFDTACSEEDYKNLAGVDGIAYSTHCGRVYRGGVQCFQDYDCLDPNRYFYHAESLEECLRFCVTLHPRCRIVSWNPGLEVGFANCWARYGDKGPVLDMPNSKQVIMHSAEIVEDPKPDSKCPEDKVYRSGGEANGTGFDIHCGQLNQGLNITNLQAQNVTDCMDACAADNQGCQAILFTPVLDDGYHNCYLQKTINEVVDQANATYAAISPSDHHTEGSSGSSQNQTDPGSSPSKAWIAGPVVGGIVTLAAIGYAIFWWRRRKSVKASAMEKCTKPVRGPEYRVGDYDSGAGEAYYNPPTTRSEVHATSTSELPASYKYGHNHGPTSEAQELPS